MSFKHLLVLSVSVFFLLFSGNSTAQNYTVINDASSYSGCNCYRLTPAVNDQGGGVYQNNTINLNNSFDYTFNVFLGCNGSGGADGIVFILTNNITGIGAQGGGLGYSGLSGNSFAVEYDTWQNSQDPSYDHIAFEAGGSVNHNVAGPVPALASQAMIDDCNWHTTEIIWNVNTQTYSVYFDGTLRLTYTGNIVNNFFAGNPIVNWGWSGSTGGGNNDQRFCVTQTSSWTAGTNYQSCNPTMQFRDISTTNVGSVQSWAWNFGDPGSGASNTSTLQNPSHTFSTTGTFTVSLTITDVTGCTNTYSHIVTINPPISLSATPQSPTCNGAANGNIPTTITGGFGAAAGYGGYQYIWSNGAQTSGEVGVTAGTYTVTVNDGVCSATASYTLTQPAALTATTSHTDASCGSNNGSVSMTITGGTQPYTGVNWNLVPASGSGNGPYVRNNVPAAIYVADFHDANGCSALLTYRETVNSLPCGYNISTSSTNVNCYGQSTGSVTVTVTGGTGPSIYWTNSGGTNVGSGATLSNLPAGAYTYHYSDANGQNFTGTVTVNQPGAAMVATLATTNATCSYLNNGSAVASVTANGNSPYSYAWSASGQGNSPSASNLSQGAISVVITDNLGCTATASGTISGQPAIVPGTVTTTSTSCRGDSTGSAVVSPSGGVSPYTYLWNNSPTAIGAGDYGIPAGTYTVTVTDHNGCTAQASGTVGQPAAAFTVTPAHTDVACFGNTTGTITLTQAGGTPAYATPLWLDGPTGTTRSNLAAGTYYFADSDSHGCLVIDSIKILQPSSAFTVTAAHTNVNCFGAATGTITLTETGGTTPYGAVTWSGGLSGTNPINVAAGTYNYTVTDANSCQQTGSVTVTQPASAFTVTAAHTNVNCFGASTGTITLTETGGTTPYSAVTWSGGLSGTNPINEAAGTYNYTVTDANSCQQTGSVTVTQPAAAFTVTATHTDVNCFGASTGTITLTETGGTTPYGAVTWSGGLSGTNPINVAAGTYNYTVSDANSCQQTGSVTVTQPAAAFTVTAAHTNVNCFGASTGTITLTEAGGTTPYGAVTWSGGLSGTNPINVAAGTYNYTVTDANSCQQTGSVTVTQPASAFTVTAAHTNVNCFGASTGTITLTETGGTTPYSAVTWSGGLSGTNPINVAAGTYNYTVTDANSCQQTGSVTVTQPAAAFTVTATHTDVNCFGAATGTITLTEAGGTTPYGTVTWSGGLSGTNPINVAAGTYNYTVSDANSCQQTGSVTVTQPTSAFSVTAAHTNVLCYSASTGTITLTETGGTTPYSAVTWSGGLSGTNPINVAAGTYNYTVTDANSCQQTGSVTVAEPATAFTVTSTHVDVLCFGNSTGSITLTQAGGSPVYASPRWLDGPTGTTRSNLPAGSYYFADSDSHGCLVIDSIKILQPASAFTVTATHTDVNCFGAATGTITLIETGGTTPYGAVTWSGGLTGTNPINVAAGTYNYTVTDANSCQQTGSVTVTQPAAAFTVTAAHTDVRCKGVPTGTITLTETGGTTPYGAVTWSGGLSGTNPINVAAGTYNYTVTDANSCQQTGSVTVAEPANVFAVTSTHVDVTCYGASTGSLALSQSGGTPAYATPRWLDGPTGTTRSNLPVGTYYFADSDSHGCLVVDSVTILGPANGFIVTATHTDVQCFGGATGTITLTETGGTTPYTAVTWTGGLSGTSPTNVPAGSYTYSVSDAGGCQQTATVTVTQPAAAFSVTATHTDVLCRGGSSGTITLTEAGGTTPYGAVTWSGGLSGTNPINVAAGTYNYTVTDANSCQQTGSVTVAEPASVFSVSETHVNVACFGNNTGSITLTGSGGTTPYGTAWWSDGATGNVRSNLLAGTYNYTDSDHNGCLVTGSVTITQPATGGMTITTTETDATCSYNSNGSATATVSGGVSPYGFSWSGGFTQNDPSTSTNSNLAPAAYTVTVTDANGCTASGTTTVNAPARITAQLAVTNVTCFGGTNGSVTVTSGGGTGTIGYTWSANAGSPGNSPTASNLAAGTYQVTLTDANGCQLDTFATVSQPASGVTFATPVFVKNVSCNGGSDGEIRYTVSGGTGPYAYTWSGSAAGSGNDATNLAAASYDVTITDANGCSVTNTQVVTEPTAVTITTQSQTNVTCNGNTDGTATLTASGGTPGGVYTYVWSPSVSSGNTATGLAAGLYTVVVSDNNSCTVQTTFTITAPPAISASLAPVNVLCHGGNNGSITVTASGGTPAVAGYVYTWTPNVSTTNAATGLTAGSYSVVVSDSLGCNVTRSATITEPAALVLTAASVVSVSCSRDSNGQITFAASGGTPGYQYAISPDGVTFSSPNGSGVFTDLKIGTYTGQVTDANGCTSTATATITAPDSVTVAIKIDTVKCYGENNGALTVTSTGGTPGYTYDFSGGISNTTGIDQGLVAGNYGVTVTDSRGCAQTYQVVVPQPDSLQITITPEHPTVNLGETTVIQASSNSPYEVIYNWSPAEGLSNTTGSNVSVTTNNSMLYSVTAYINPHGEHCTVNLQVPVTVTPIYNVYVPNAFTPNDDGINDVFEIYGNKKTFKFVEVSVFDRWGERVFFSNDVNFQWDGTYNGVKLEPGTFVYQISIVFIDEHAQPDYKGSLLLIR